MKMRGDHFYWTRTPSSASNRFFCSAHCSFPVEASSPDRNKRKTQKSGGRRIHRYFFFFFYCGSARYTTERDSSHSRDGLADTSETNDKQDDDHVVSVGGQRDRTEKKKEQKAKEKYIERRQRILIGP